MLEITELLTTGGVAVLVGVIIEYIAKALIRRRLGLPPYGHETTVKMADYKVIINIVAAVLGILVALVATVVLIESTGETLLAAVVNGFMGGLMAIGGSELIANIRER